ncbi:SxtJ family membrane protein [Brumicola pallidula]|jgi:hypothetical protein|uniref:SxtJ n=1 Tax=Brumicola pallidula DSM 14239 = ACAM 615 TaxID=1121922 RepID=K6ZCY0_9ALTE|nr:SxtJ family membrane protein [Glaciecola pallidula]GAC28207.1 hypothetical protein GPAL_1334 [Glaciecola pallidula DSM 14239 = ACAM 615]
MKNAVASVMTSAVTSVVKNAVKKIMLPLANKNDIKAMRAFALTMSIAVPSVFMLLLPWLFGHAAPYWPAGISTVMMLLYWVFPKGIYYPYYGWMIIASVLGWFNTKLILALIFYVVITPIGLIMTTFGKLQYKTHVSGHSNWVKPLHTDARKDKKRLEEPF